MKNTIQFSNWLNKWNNWEHVLTISGATILFVVIVVLFLSLKRRKLIFFSRSANDKVKNADFQCLPEYEPRHNWQLTDLFIKPTYCNVCETMMVSGVCCTYCNLYADEKCLKRAENTFKCKKICNSIFSFEKKQDGNKRMEQTVLADLSKAPFKLLSQNWSHHWIKGNLQLNSVCFLCQTECGNEPSLSDFKCVWCWRFAHEKCLNNISSFKLVGQCDFGQFKQMLLTPNLVVQKIRSHDLTLREVRLDEQVIQSAYNIEQWTPLFVFANKKSGNNDAEAIISHFNTILNPLQVIEFKRILFFWLHF